jgi:predicted RNA-binding protein with PIN domain
MKKATARTELRIVHQARTERVRTYHLACEQARVKLEVGIVQSDGTDRWHVHATGRTRATSDDLIGDGEATTKTDALRALARVWREAPPHYPTLDWEAIETLLGQVNGL